jgi:hypothetical protein
VAALALCVPAGAQSSGLQADPGQQGQGQGGGNGQDKQQDKQAAPSQPQGTQTPPGQSAQPGEPAGGNGQQEPPGQVTESPGQAKQEVKAQQSPKTRNPAARPKTTAPSRGTPRRRAAAAPVARTRRAVARTARAGGSATRTRGRRSGGRAGAPAARRPAPSFGRTLAAPSLRRPDRRSRLTTTDAPLVAPAPYDSQSPFERTLGRIVEVVPTSVWLVIAGLIALVALLGGGYALAALRARRLAHQREVLLQDVGLLQAALLPPVPESVGGVATSAAYQPADGPAAGGDFYDVISLDDGRVGVLIGDVTGHGRAALSLTALIRYTLRAYLEAGLTPRTALQVGAGVLDRQLSGQEATAAIATWDPANRTLTYASAGHPPPVIVGTDHEPITVASSPPIGAALVTGLRQTSVTIPGPAVVCFYTDGILDARRGADLYGYHRLRASLEALGPEATASAVLAAVAAETDRQPDDMAACVLGLEGERAGAPTRLEELEFDQTDVEAGRPERFLKACGLSPGALAHLELPLARAGAGGGAVLEVLLTDGEPEVHIRARDRQVVSIGRGAAAPGTPGAPSAGAGSG